jgi:transposase
MAQRGPYRKFSSEVRNSVLQVAANGGDWQYIAEALHVPYTTAYGWLQRADEIPRQRGGDRRSKLSPQQIAVIVSWLEDNSQLTIAAIRDRIQAELGVFISQQTVSRYLDGCLISFKKVHLMPLGINTPPNKQLRQVFVGNLLQAIAANKFIMFVDETNYNLFCRRTCGRARRGERAVVKLPNSKGPNLHIIGGISSNGVVHWERQRGAFKIPNFNAWLSRCLEAAIATGVHPNAIVVVIDNAPAHSRAEEVVQEDAFQGTQVLRLAPYSPMLNAIETIWSMVKARLKASLQGGFEELIAGDPVGILTQGEFRIRYLERCVDIAMPYVTSDMCAMACNHVQSHFEAALLLQDMPVGQ